MALSNKEKQAAFRKRKREQGLRDRLFYVTPAQEEAIKGYLAGSGEIVPGTISFRPVDISSLEPARRETLKTGAERYWLKGNGMGGEKKNLETVRRGLQEADGGNPAWSFRDAAKLAGTKRTDPTPGELAQAVTGLYAEGYTLAKIGEILSLWGKE